MMALMTDAMIRATKYHTSLFRASTYSARDTNLESDDAHDESAHSGTMMHTHNLIQQPAANKMGQNLISARRPQPDTTARSPLLAAIENTSILIPEDLMVLIPSTDTSVPCGA